jgi:outer membrane receptor protein involved in Fe transport
VRLPGGFSLAASAEASKGDDPDTGAAVDDIAPPGAALTLRHAAGDRRSAFVRIEAVGRHRHAGPSEVPTPSYQLLDAGVRQRLSAFVWVVVSARNLLDDAYPSSAGPRWVWAPGRQIAVAMTVAF